MKKKFLIATCPIDVIKEDYRIWLKFYNWMIIPSIFWAASLHHLFFNIFFAGLWNSSRLLPNAIKAELSMKISFVIVLELHKDSDHAEVINLKCLYPQHTGQYYQEIHSMDLPFHILFRQTNAVYVIHKDIFEILI